MKTLVKALIRDLEDDIRNVIIRKPAMDGKSQAIVMQGHLDMETKKKFRYCF
jgi:di/tripeptidase